MPTSANIVVVPCKRTQQVTTLLGPTMLGVVGQQCWVRLHGSLRDVSLFSGGGGGHYFGGDGHNFSLLSGGGSQFFQGFLGEGHNFLKYFY